MMNVIRRLSTSGALLSIALFGSSARAQTAPTAADLFFHHFDIGVSGVGEFTPNNAGPNYLSQTVSQRPSTTLGALVEVRYTKSPLVGLQFNYGYARYTDDFTVTNGAGTPGGSTQYVLGAQTKVSEFTLGYVAHLHEFHGVTPIVGGGGGAIAFRPTPGGGQGLPPELRGAFYYSLGVEKDIYTDHVGIRAQFRQLFFGAPDFNQNYLANGQRSFTIEPSIGFYLRF